jgi:hypothetical protein
VECENYTSLEEKGDKYHDINGENYLLFHQYLKQFIYLSLYQSSDDSSIEEEHEVSLNVLENFHKII